MTINSDFVIVKNYADGLLFWGGRSGWESHPSYAHVYTTRAKAESAMNRNRWRFDDTCGYATLSEAMEEYQETLPQHVKDRHCGAYATNWADGCDVCGKPTLYRCNGWDSDHLTQSWCGCGYNAK